MGPDVLSKIERESRRRLNWNNDGRWGIKSGYEDEDWRVVVKRPKKSWWAKSTAYNKKPRQTHVHAVRYQVLATWKRTGEQFTKTVWLCGGHTFSKVQSRRDPEEVCAKCQHHLVGQAHGTVRLS